MPQGAERAPAVWRIALEAILQKRAEIASQKAIMTRNERDFKEAGFWTRFLNKPDPETSIDDGGGQNGRQNGQS